VVDSVFISQRDDQTTASVALRVFAQDFDGALAFMEGLGKVQSKELNEGKAPKAGAPRPKEPDASIHVSLAQEEGVRTGLIIIAVAASLGGLVLAALLGLLFYYARRARRQPGPTPD
jgi:hypothetical protein